MTLQLLHSVFLYEENLIFFFYQFEENTGENRKKAGTTGTGDMECGLNLPCKS
jgi:hypothetical protein